jgi:hypothetical protein
LRRYSPSHYTFFLLLTTTQRVFVYCSNFLTSALFALLPLAAGRQQMQLLWPSLDADAISIIAVCLATLFVAQSSFTWTFSRIPFLFWNHMQNSRRLHHSLLQFASIVFTTQCLDPAHLMLEFKLWTARHGQLLDARRALDSTFNGPFGLLLCAVALLAATLVVQLFVDKLGLNNLQTVCVQRRLRLLPRVTCFC